MCANTYWITQAFRNQKVQPNRTRDNRLGWDNSPRHGLLVVNPALQDSFSLGLRQPDGCCPNGCESASDNDCPPPPPPPASSVHPDPDYPMYWQVDGSRTLLIGGFDHGEPLLLTGEALTDPLDQLVAAGITSLELRGLSSFLDR